MISENARDGEAPSVLAKAILELGTDECRALPITITVIGKASKVWPIT